MKAHIELLPALPKKPTRTLFRNLQYTIELKFQHILKHQHKIQYSQIIYLQLKHKIAN